jgi:PTS system ascorbate-specific IIA component
MTAILVVAHEPLAGSLQRVAEHVYPDCARQLAVLDVPAGASREQVAADIRRMLARWPDSEALILVDMFGATPANAACDVADGQRVRIVAGVNVPMLWRTLCYAEEPLAALVQRAVDGGSRGVLHVPTEASRQNQSSPPGRHDPNDDPHQQ